MPKIRCYESLKFDVFLSNTEFSGRHYVFMDEKAPVKKAPIGAFFMNVF